MKTTKTINGKEYLLDEYRYFSDSGGIRVNDLILGNNRGDGEFSYYIVKGADLEDFKRDESIQDLNIYAPTAKIYIDDVGTLPYIVVDNCHIFKRKTSFYFVQTKKE